MPELKSTRWSVLRQRSRSFLLWAVVVPIGILFGSGLGVRTLLVEAFKIPAASMSPTLLVGDHIFVTKYDYMGGQLPARGDVVVFQYPYSEDGKPPDYVKRVVGLPGDELAFERGLLSIDGKPVPTCLVGRARLQNGTSNAEFDIYLERLGEHSYLVALESGMSHRADGPYVVPEGEVWMAGDNRANSLDSRFWRRSGSSTPGAGVPASFIKGRASRVWMPAARFWTEVNAEPTLPPELSMLSAALAACQGK